MCCSYEKCQFSNFFNKDTKNDFKLYFDVDETKDSYCIFHAPKEVKEKFTHKTNQLYNEYLDRYIEYCINRNSTIDFRGTVFYLPFVKKDINASLVFFNFTTTKEVIFEEPLDIDFSNAVFIKDFRMDNVKCGNLIFKDTIFYSGGGIKNKGEKNKVYIQKLVLRPYQLESDFVIDIGKYANSDGIMEVNKYGVIENIRFENHKIGSGIIYFIGLNRKLKKANFRNMKLDNVSFQNSNLSKCYFLNAKVDLTEFRNCEFKRKADFVDNKIILYASIVTLMTWGIIVYTNMKSLYLVLLYIFGMLVIFTMAFNSHLSIYDENNDNLIDKKTKESISETYASLRNNLSKNDYQKAGDFFYSQRFIQLLSTNRIYDKFLYFLHYIINGFGENFVRPLNMFLLTVLLFGLVYMPNKDFIATESTPKYLIIDKMELEKYYKLQQYKDSKNTIHVRRYVSNKFPDLNKTILWSKAHLKSAKDREYISLIYSCSQFISPIVNKNRAWFKTISPKASIYNFIETILLYIFFSAFLLAIKNRIKR